MRKSIALTSVAMLGMILVGCSSNSASPQPPQKQQTTPSQNQIQGINPSQPSESIQSTAQLPTIFDSVLSELKNKNKFPVYLPTYIPKVNLQNNQFLDVDSQNLVDGYTLTLFINYEKGNKVYSMADQVATISASTKKAIPNSNQEMKYQKPLKLDDGITVEYLSTNDPPVNAIGSDEVKWQKDNWTFITSGSPSNQLNSSERNDGTITMAKNLEKSIVENGLPVQKVKEGYVEALALGNRLIIEVAWTYDDLVWYSIGGSSMQEALDMSRSMINVSDYNH